MPFQPLANYTGYNHVLFAGATFVHPGNGNIYFCACEQVSGIHQNLSVYRMLATTAQIELVKRYQGGASDSPAQITMGAAVIGQGGGMIVATSLIIPGVPQVTGSGWQGSWIREPNIDAPWSLAGAGGGGGLSAEDSANLAWLKELRAVLRSA